MTSYLVRNYAVKVNLCLVRRATQSPPRVSSHPKGPLYNPKHPPLRDSKGTTKDPLSPPPGSPKLAQGPTSHPKGPLRSPQGPPKKSKPTPSRLDDFLLFTGQCFRHEAPRSTKHKERRHAKTHGTPKHEPPRNTKHQETRSTKKHGTPRNANNQSSRNTKRHETPGNIAHKARNTTHTETQHTKNTNRQEARNANKRETPIHTKRQETRNINKHARSRNNVIY